MYTFSLKQTRERKVSRGKHGRGEVPGFNIGTLHFMVDWRKEPIDRRDEGGEGYTLLLLLLLLLLLSRLSRVRLCATPEKAARQAPPSLGFSRQEHWSGLPFPSPMHESEKWKSSHSVVSDPQRPHGLQPTRLLRPWDLPGKSTGVGCHCLLRGNMLSKSKNKTFF